jgi:hypothetical protein
LNVNGLLFLLKMYVTFKFKAKWLSKNFAFVCFSSFICSYFLSLFLFLSPPAFLCYSCWSICVSVSLFLCFSDDLLIYFFLYSCFSLFLCFCFFVGLFVCFSVIIFLSIFLYLSFSLHSFCLPQVQGRFDCILLWLFIGWLTRETVKYKKEEKKNIFTQSFIFPVILVCTSNYLQNFVIQKIFHRCHNTAHFVKKYV